MILLHDAYYLVILLILSLSYRTFSFGAFMLHFVWSCYQLSHTFLNKGNVSNGIVVNYVLL